MNSPLSGDEITPDFLGHQRAENTDAKQEYTVGNSVQNDNANSQLTDYSQSAIYLVGAIIAAFLGFHILKKFHII